MLTDLTILNSGHRHLVCNGNAQVGWLTACGDRISVVGLNTAQVRRVSEVRCPSCLRAMTAADY